MIKEMPLSKLSSLISYADKKETEKVLYPIWLVHYLTATIAGQEAMSYEDLLKSVESKPKSQEKQKTAEEILAQFAPIAEADLRRENSNG